MTQVATLFSKLDHALTGRDRLGTLSTYPQDVEALLDDGIVYLADGGYSRIVFREEQEDDGTWLATLTIDRSDPATSGSRAAVIDKWDNCAIAVSLREELIGLLTDQLNAL